MTKWSRSISSPFSASSFTWRLVAQGFQPTSPSASCSSSVAASTMSLMYWTRSSPSSVIGSAPKLVVCISRWLAQIETRRSAGLASRMLPSVLLELEAQVARDAPRFRRVVEARVRHLARVDDAPHAVGGEQPDALEAGAVGDRDQAALEVLG